MLHRLSFSASVAALAIGLASPALAQDATPADGDEQTIIVTGQRAQQQKAIDEKRNALGIQDVAAADEIGQLPDRNVAEVIERLPGVGVQYDQGEGRYVSVRGVPSDLNNYTINGFEIGNPDGLTRRLPLDIVSGQLLNRVEVSKVKTADQDGQGIGGTINLVTQTAFDFRDSFVLQGSAQVGYQELNKEYPVRGDASIGGRFGADEQFGILIGGSYSERTFASFGFFPDDWAPTSAATRGGIPINYKVSEYELKRERIGATASLDWRPSDGTELYVRGLYSKFTEDEYRQRFRLDFSNATPNTLLGNGRLRFNADGLTGTSTQTDQRQDLRLEYKEKSVLALSAGGKATFDALTLEFAASRIHNEVIEPNRAWTFRDAPGTVDFDFSEKIYTATPRTPLGGRIGFRSYTEQDEYGEEDIWAGRLDATYDLNLGENSFVKFGAKYRTTDKYFDAENRAYDRAGAGPNRFTLGDFGLSGPAVLSEVGRGYLINPSINAEALVAFTDQNLSEPRFVLNTNTTLANGTLSDFSIEEDILAGYAMANLEFGQIAVTAGVRVEQTKLDITGFQLRGSTVIPVTGSTKYTDVLPSVIVRITPADDVVIRLGYSRAVGRPNYNSLSPGGRITVDGNEAAVSLGNPTLKPYAADALDASAEYYFAPGGLLSVGVFAKFIKDPIFTQSYTVTNGSVGGVNYARISYSQPLNAGKADIIGVEANYQQQFTGLPGFLSGFGIGANITLTESNLDGNAFPEQADLLYGAQLFYQKGPVEASVAYHHTGRSLISVGGTPFEDQANDDLRRLDAKASFAITPNVTVFFEGQNLTDEPTRQYQGGNRDWVIQNERYGRTFYAGFSAKW